MSTNSNINTGFSKELKRLRGKLKKKKFAEILGVEYPTYLRYESGEIKPKLPIMKLARILSKSVDVKYEIDKSTVLPLREPKEVPYDIDQLLEDVRRILTSKNQAAIDALKRNIRYFNHTIGLEQRMAEMEDRIKTLEVKNGIAAGDATAKKKT